MHKSNFADCFEEKYILSKHWSKWFLGASGVEGIMGNNNALEVAQRVQKNKEAENICCASNKHIFSVTIPSIIKNAKLHKSAGIVSNGAIPSDIVNNVAYIVGRCKGGIVEVNEGYVVCGIYSNNGCGNLTET